MMRIFIKCMLALCLGGILLVLMSAALLHGWVVPHMNDLRPRIETYLSEQTGHPVRIGNIAAESSGYLPSFDLKDVQILDAEQNPALTLGRVQVSVSPLSLLTLEIDRLTIDTPTLRVTRDAAGEITVAGFKIDQGATSSKTSDWIFSQKEIVIRGGTISWTDAQPHLFGEANALSNAIINNVALTIKNGLRSHNILLEATPPEAFGKEVSISGKFSQPLLETNAGRWQAWTGNVTTHIKSIPAVANQIKADIDWPLRNVSIEGEQLMLESLVKLAQSLGQPLPQDMLSGAAQSIQAERFKLQIKDARSDKLQAQLAAKFANLDLAGDLDVAWKKEGDKLDATVNMTRSDLVALHRYVPAQAPPALRQTLQNVLQKGVATNVRFIARGPLKDFPFTNTKTGELRLTGKVSDAQLILPQKIDATKTSWPNLEQTEFSFNLNGMQLSVDNIQTELGGLASKGSVRISDLRKPVLEIKTDLKGLLPTAMTIVNASPLKTLTKELFTTSEATGPFTARMQINMPLAAPAQSKVTGQIQLEGNDFLLDPETPPLSRVKGAINFTQAGFQLDNLRGTALGGEIKLSGNSQKIVGSGVLSAEGLAAWTRMPMRLQLAPHLSGKAPYTWSLEPRLGGAGLIVESSLVGMQVNLPAPLSKPAASSWPLRVQQIKTSAKQDRLSLSLSHVAAAEFVRDTSAGIGKPAVVQRGSVVLTSRPSTGADAARVPQDLLLPEQGVSAMLHLDLLDLGAWTPLLALENPSAASSDFASYIPNQIAAHIETVKFASRSFTQVVLGASKVGRTWRLNTNASDFNGYGEYRSQSSDQAGQLFMRLARLVIPDANSQSQIELLLQAAPDRIPALDVIVEDFEVIGKKVGRIEILAVNQRSQGYLGPGIAQEWRVQKLNITNPDATVKATGVWLPSSDIGSERGNKRRVDVQFNLDVIDSGALLTRFGLPGTIKAGKGSLQGRTAWVGSPWAINIPTLAGQLKMDMSKGQFLKIEPGRAGRFFNVLSLQALPRLLTLDFRDVFSDGFAFDSLTGDALINDGVLTTKNLEMKSVLALVSMDGSVDIAKETQNLHVLVLPDINAGGVSLLATLINPVIGAATYLAQLVLRRPVVAAATKEYSIQGSWQEPQITPFKQGVPQPTP